MPTEGWEAPSLARPSAKSGPCDATVFVRGACLGRRENVELSVLVEAVGCGTRSGVGSWNGETSSK